MKKTVLLLCAIFVFILSNLHAYDRCCFLSNVEVSFRGSAYIPYSNKARKIYSTAFPDVQVEVEKYIRDPFSVWLGVQYLWQNGHSLGLHNKTNLWMVPISFGAKYNFRLNNCAHLYAGVGAVYSFLRIHDHSRYVHQHVNKGAWGGLIKTGVKYYINGPLFVEGFADFLFQRFSFSTNHHSEHFVERHNANMNAVIVGGGVGCRF